MPKISLHVDADSTEDLLSFLAAFRPPLALGGQHTFPQAQAQTVQPMPEEIKAKLAEAEAAKEQPSLSQPIEAAPMPDITPAEKPARKPRTPKMTPVIEEAPEEVEHVGTLALRPDGQTNGATEVGEEVLTRMDLGDTIAGYVRKYGINFAQTDVSKMLQDMFGADVRKKSDVPDDQKSLKKAITTITQATIDNPYNRKVDVNG